MSFNLPTGDDLRPELELILCCARARSTDSSPERLRALLGGPLDWADVVATSLEHHVETSVCESLESFGNGLVPAESLELLRTNARKTAGLSLLYFSELVRLQATFDAASVPLIPYKGPVLSWLAYGNITRRRFLDLDFFVPHAQISRASELLISAGLEAAPGQREEMAGRKAPVPGQYAFSRTATRAQIELHTERTLRYFPVPLDFDKMRQRLITVEVGGNTLRTFSIEDTLIMLCVHGAKHFWERIGWVLDVARLIGAQSVDWEKTMRIAAKLKSIRLVLLGVYLADELLGAPAPASIILKAQHDSSVMWLAGKVRAELAAKMPSRAGVLPRALFRYRSRDNGSDAICHVLRLATSPTETDRQSLRLPAFLASFYPLVRPWKLLREYGIGAHPRTRPDLGHGGKNKL